MHIVEMKSGGKGGGGKIYMYKLSLFFVLFYSGSQIELDKVWVIWIPASMDGCHGYGIVFNLLYAICSQTCGVEEDESLNHSICQMWSRDEK